jgi:hypothetical protein
MACEQRSEFLFLDHLKGKIKGKRKRKRKENYKNYKNTVREGLNA